MNTPISLHGSTFLEGIPGTGKTTTAAYYAGQLIAAGVAPERLLVLVPQPTQGRAFREAAFTVQAAGGTVDAHTFIGFAARMVRTFWPLLAERAGFADPASEPIFLNIETTQYYLARLANPIMATGVFTGTVSLPPQRIRTVTCGGVECRTPINAASRATQPQSPPPCPAGLPSGTNGCLPSSSRGLC